MVERSLCAHGTNPPFRSGKGSENHGTSATQRNGMSCKAELGRRVHTKVEPLGGNEMASWPPSDESTPSEEDGRSSPLTQRTYGDPSPKVLRPGSPGPT